ncbi:protein SPT2-like protein [Gossypium australe]|uniref:Protein SPT2-like protein n=1 Tax=Gossypium australe TaxID=47621 RepID=A0A5B6UJK5_9ROSI|nr:protein SPT2-like protein [Gossypium australe]
MVTKFKKRKKEKKHTVLSFPIPIRTWAEFTPESLTELGKTLKCALIIQKRTIESIPLPPFRFWELLFYFPPIYLKPISFANSSSARSKICVSFFYFSLHIFEAHPQVSLFRGADFSFSLGKSWISLVSDPIEGFLHFLSDKFIQYNKKENC